MWDPISKEFSHVAGWVSMPVPPKTEGTPKQQSNDLVIRGSAFHWPLFIVICRTVTPYDYSPLRKHECSFNYMLCTPSFQSTPVLLSTSSDGDYTSFPLFPYRWIFKHPLRFLNIAASTVFQVPNEITPRWHKVLLLDGLKRLMKKI